MKKLIAFVAVSGFSCFHSCSPINISDSAVETYPRPLVLNVEEV